MQILGRTEAKQKRFCVGGREVLRIDLEQPAGDTPAARHILGIVQALCANIEREQLPLAAEALKNAVEAGQGHRFARRYCRIALDERASGKRCRVTVSVTLSCQQAQGDQVLYLRTLETLWDAQGVLQADVKKERPTGLWRFWRGGVKRHEKAKPTNGADKGE